jgi:hypothetical protein
MFMQPREWRKAFENKTESELEALTPPPGLPTVFLKMWRRERDEALAGVRPPASRTEEPEQPEDDEDAEKQQLSFSKERDALEAALTALENDTSGAPAGPRAQPAQSPLEIPRGNAADLLEQQIGTCAALIGNIANYVAHSDTEANVCLPFMDRIASLLSSSATAARVVGQLRGIANETRQTFITEKGGKGVGGVPQT